MTASRTRCASRGIRLGTCRALHRTVEDNKLLTEQRVFGKQASPAAGEISNGAQEQGRMCRLGPMEYQVVNALSATVSQGLNQGKEMKHSTRSSLSTRDKAGRAGEHTDVSPI
jgi:hypothetical protein